MRRYQRGCEYRHPRRVSHKPCVSRHALTSGGCLSDPRQFSTFCADNIHQFDPGFNELFLRHRFEARAPMHRCLFPLLRIAAGCLRHRADPVTSHDLLRAITPKSTPTTRFSDWRTSRRRHLSIREGFSTGVRTRFGISHSTRALCSRICGLRMTRSGRIPRRGTSSLAIWSRSARRICSRSNRPTEHRTKHLPKMCRVSTTALHSANKLR